MSAASSNNRIREYLQSLPTVTVALLLFNITIHVAIFVTSASLGKYAISVNMVNCIFYRNNSALHVMKFLIFSHLLFERLVIKNTFLFAGVSSWRILPNVYLCVRSWRGAMLHKINHLVMHIICYV